MAESGMEETRSVTLLPATAIVVGNMVGTGVFTSLGFQVLGIQSGFVLLVLWALGGVCALCGALCYGELAAALPRSGGEYHLLSRIFHPAVGFLAGWISITVGFAAPIALGAMAFGTYVSGIMTWEGEFVAEALSVVVVLLVATIHLLHIGVGSRFQSVCTSLKVVFIVVLISSAFFIGEPQGISFLPQDGDLALLGSHSFAISLVFVMYAYTGWNAATYIVDEVKEPRKTVPRALLLGTILVMALYLGLNAAFLHSTPIAEMRGKLDVGLIAAKSIFGEAGGRMMASLICFGLISALSAMTWAGPRVAQRMGQDLKAFRLLARTSRTGIPFVAVLWQSAVVLLLIATSTFDAVLVYIELLLVFFGMLTVAGVFWLRFSQPDLERPVKTWGYPVTPLIFISVSVWMMIYVAQEKPMGALWGVVTLAVGGVVYLIAQRTQLRSSGKGPRKP
jgi:APA family basic amino acid/polyamine antiporter